MITSGASSTFSATARRVAGGARSCARAERGVEHAEQQLHQHRDVAGADLAERAADDQHLAPLDHAIEVDRAASR